jgi:hypothetical protein
MSLYAGTSLVRDFRELIFVVSLLTDLAVVANEGQRIDIPDGCILENRLLSGNLNLIVRSHEPTFVNFKLTQTSSADF